MAISFSRPDPSSPAAVAGASFATSRRGFDPAEVRDFLRMVSAELARLQERERFLERELASQPAARPLVPADMDDDRVAELLGEETARVIQAAREAAAKIRGRAEDTAQRLIRDATDEAARIREEADLEVARIRQDAAADAESEVVMAKQQGRDMVNEARAYRERVLADVARRRELAREQLEDLVHGRDRLVQAFERARLATDDVLRDLVDVGDEPAAYVNLTPTTGPVPIMVPVEDLDAHSTRSPSGPALYDQDRDDESAVVEMARHVADFPAAPVEDVNVGEADHDVEAHDDAAIDDAATGDDVATVEDITADEPVVAPAEESAPSNVVPLFGKSESKGDESSEAKPAARNERPAPPVAADDIFAKLRKANADLIAERAAGVAPKRAKADEPAPSREPVARTVEPISSKGIIERAVEKTVESIATFETRDEVLVPLILTMGRKIKRILADEQNQVLDTCRKRTIVKTLDAIVGPKSEHAKRVCTALAPSLKSAAIAGARSLHTARTMPSDRELNEMVAPQLKAIDEVVVTTIVEPLRERLSRSISSAGGSNAELASLVRVLYREWKNQFIDEHIDDIAYTAFGRGALAALSPEMNVCWKYDPAGPACPDAEDNSLAGCIAGGEAFPTGHTHAPAHSGCRCAIVPMHN